MEMNLSIKVQNAQENWYLEIKGEDIERCF